MAIEVYHTFSLAASWINCMLFVLEIALIVQYFHSPRPLLHRIGVVSIFLFDVVCTGAVCAEVYATILIFPCQPFVFLDPTLQPLAAILFATYATASLEQLFLCSLYYALTKRWLITSILVTFVAVHLAFSYASAILILKTGSPGGAAFLTTKLGAILCAVTDIMIAATLLYTFIRMEITSAVRARTHSLLRRLMVLIFTSGVVVASTTSFVMIFLLTFNFVYLLFFYAQGRIYALTILANFLVGLPETQTPTTVAPGTAVTAVVFHVDYQSSVNARAEVTCDYDHRGNEPLDAVDMDNMDTVKSQAHSD
ncbi:hypothetical protein FB451DRAFT_276961 [Mycena latifolia]|nr:hypothetical protein FB451DRAFT_276961 [Mycena latifolia]